jgi:hypothetical protein
VPEVRQAFSKYAEVEHIKTIGPADLDIFKEENQVVIAFAYNRRVPLVGNVSLLIEFRSSTSGAVTARDRRPAAAGARLRFRDQALLQPR